MKVYVNEISGIADAIVSMFISKRNWSRDKETGIRALCDTVLDRSGRLNRAAPADDLADFADYMDKLVKWGWKHTTMLRFIDFSITVDGLHRAGQDDWDAHACRYNNRIIRASTRLSSFGYELSDWYRGRIIPTDQALALLGVTVPDRLETGGKTFVKSVNGYVLEEAADDPDTKRGLYMLSIPSSFIFKVNLTEWAHVFKERNAQGHSNPEVKQLCEGIADQLHAAHVQLDRELFLRIRN